VTRGTAARVVLLALSVRVASAGIAYGVNVTLPPFEPARRAQPDFARFDPLWSTFTRYDAGWYVSIARWGYVANAEGASNIAFFPLYPLAMRWTRSLLRGMVHPMHLSYYAAGIVVSWICFPLALLLLYAVARSDVDEGAAGRAVLYASLFPFAFYFGEVYTESLFLMLTLLSFYGFRSGRLLLGGISGGLACATRVNGIFALPALALVGWSAARRKRGGLTRLCGALVLVAAGLGAYCLYVYDRTGNPLEWASRIERGWDYTPGGAPWRAYAAPLQGLLSWSHAIPDPALPCDLLNGAAALLMVAAVPLVWARFGAGYALFVLVNLWVPLSSGALEGLGRYSAVLFPFFLWIGEQRHGAIRVSLLLAFAMFYVVALTMFTLGYALH
jgi:Mannosyltransferase (PIG-V)